MQTLTKNMCLNTTENNTTPPINASDLIVDDGTDNTTRKIGVLYIDDRSFTRFQFQFLLNDTANDVVVMYICVVIFFLGIIGNIVTMAKIISDSKYHTPTFAAIGYLALPDFFSVISLSGFYFTNILFIRKLSIKYFIILDNFLYFSCSGHMLLLSFVRYLITVHPLQSRQHLTVLAVSFCSLSVWVLSALCGVGYYNTYIYMSLKFQIWFVISVSTIVVVLVCAITITLHARKIKTIKNSLSVTRQSQTRMNLVVTIIIMIFVLSHIFIITKYVLEHLLNVKGFISITFLRQCVALTGFLNYSCNPYILFISFTLLSRFKRKF